MTPIQAQVGIALLKKVMPDLASTEHTGETHLIIEGITRTIVRAEPTTAHHRCWRSQAA